MLSPAYQAQQSFIEKDKEKQLILEHFDSLVYQRSYDRDTYTEHYSELQEKINKRHDLGKNIDLLSQLGHQNFKIDVSLRKESPKKILECLEIIEFGDEFYCLIKGNKIKRLLEFRDFEKVSYSNALTRILSALK
ncbi:hypothetical protein GW846_00570 [Candidatus Gracilibacteria bacterium]|nr:hypothetical protein [Candidatus Gracilibacteria bacterium]